jgi:hypothetical protein
MKKKQDKIEPQTWIPFAGCDYMCNYSQHFSDGFNDLTPEEKLLLDLTQTNIALMNKLKELEK